MVSNGLGDRILSVMLVLVIIISPIMMIRIVRHSEGNDMKNYAASTQTHVVGVYPNKMTDQTNDFFVDTKDNGLIYIEVDGEKGAYTHQESYADGNESLIRMSEASVNSLNAEKGRRSTYRRNIIIPMPVFGF